MESDPRMNVRDNRLFNPDGTLRDDSATTTQTTPSPQPVVDSHAAASPNAQTQKDAQPETQHQHFSEMNFTTFMLSLATSAQVHMGLIPNPETGEPGQDLPYAKQTIDILGILEDKTKGNLTDDESRLLAEVLFQLRMIYVDITKGAK